MGNTHKAIIKTFALIGAAGYIAPRHMRAITDVGGQLVAAMDPNDSVGIIDRYFPDAAFFTEFERFDRHLEKLKRQGAGVDYIVICSPNYLHDAHIRFGLRLGANVICEKPMVLNSWNIQPLIDLEQESIGRIYNILQLRLHPSIIALKERIDKSSTTEPYKVKLQYITSRGKWYHYSWKGDQAKSGGLLSNIGIHFFDMLIWVFGSRLDSKLNYQDDQRVGGTLRLENAEVEWDLSISADDLPVIVQSRGVKTFRSIEINGVELEFSEGFADLHTQSYQRILEGYGFGVDKVIDSIALVNDLHK